MSNDQKPRAAAPMDPIPLTEIRFRGQGTHDGVNIGPPFTQNGATHMLKAQKMGNDEIKLFYEPWLRRFRALYLRGGKLYQEGDVTGEVCIPETWGCYREER
jgi:hypothetical protein